MKRLFHRTGLMLMVMALVALVGAVSAQDMMGPEVQVSDQVVLNGTVTVDYAYSDGPGFIVIHADNGSGSFGAVIGHRWLSPGANYNVAVPIDASAATSTVYAMLHVDDNTIGTYEFGSVDGADAPVIVDGAPVSPPLAVAVLNAQDQFIEGNTYTAASATVDGPGWLVIHSDNNGGPGPVLGASPLVAGINSNVAVELDEAGMTATLWPMLHVDTGVEGEYEFGTVEGADGPVRINGTVAVASVSTFPAVRMSDQIVLHGDGMDDMMMAPTATATSVLSEGLGWLVIHSDNGGAPGPVAGYAQVQPGLNTNVTVELDPAVVTPVLWPMLHVDTGAEGTYEFGTVEGADGPVRVNDAVLTFAINAAPSIVYDVTVNEDGNLVVAQALIGDAGWLVIHSDNGGSPGPVLGAAHLTPGLNTNIVITLDGDMTETVFPMLHVDTGEPGVYEFGTVDGADGPIRVGGNVVVGPATPMMSE